MISAELEEELSLLNDDDRFVLLTLLSDQLGIAYHYQCRYDVEGFWETYLPDTPLTDEQWYEIYTSTEWKTFIFDTYIADQLQERMELIVLNYMSKAGLLDVNKTLPGP